MEISRIYAKNSNSPPTRSRTVLREPWGEIPQGYLPPQCAEADVNGARRRRAHGLIFTGAIGDFISFGFFGQLFWRFYAGSCIGCFGSETRL